MAYRVVATKPTTPPGKERGTIFEDKVISFTRPGQIDDPLTKGLPTGARQLLEQTVEAELDAFLAAYAELKGTSINAAG